VYKTFEQRLEDKESDCRYVLVCKQFTTNYGEQLLNRKFRIISSVKHKVCVRTWWNSPGFLLQEDHRFCADYENPRVNSQSTFCFRPAVESVFIGDRCTNVWVPVVTLGGAQIWENAYEWVSTCCRSSNNQNPWK